MKIKKKRRKITEVMCWEHDGGPRGSLWAWTELGHGGPHNCDLGLRFCLENPPLGGRFVILKLIKMKNADSWSFKRGYIHQLQSSSNQTQSRGPDAAKHPPQISLSHYPNYPLFCFVRW